MSKSNKRDLLFITIVVGVSLLIRLVFMALNGLLVEEAYYWNYAQHLDFGYLDHPPMVALLIKLFTFILGSSEFSVHFTAIFCWGLTCYFSYRLTELISCGAGRYAVVLLAILPFFFLQSIAITPDPPVMICWAAALYCLYRALVLEEARYWYFSGIWLGLGLLSKYTIVLLGLPVLAYMSIIPSARFWFVRKEPYLCALIVLVLFTPVIYWNVTHHWVSFAFQSVQRFKGPGTISLHKWIGLIIFMLTPLGVWGWWQLFTKKESQTVGLKNDTQRFLQLFTLLPLAFFGAYSLIHPVKFDWIGPGLLALIPWLAIQITKVKKEFYHRSLRHCWYLTAVILLVLYSGSMVMVTWGIPDYLHQRAFKKYFAWGDLTLELNAVAKSVEMETKSSPIFSPLDAYIIGSELLFYQTLFLSERKIQTIYPVVGRHIYNCNSLMYKYWFNGENLSGKTLILISTELDDFDLGYVKSEVIEMSPLKLIWANTQRAHNKVMPIYYKIVKMKPYDKLYFSEPYDGLRF